MTCKRKGASSIRLLAVIVALPWLPSHSLGQAIYKCVDDSGTTYSDSPCADQMSVMSHGRWSETSKSEIAEQSMREAEEDRKRAEAKAEEDRERAEAKAEAERLAKETSRRIEEGLNLVRRRYSAQSDRVCTKEWTKREELNYRMYRHCMDQHREAHKEYYWIEQRHSGFGYFDDIALPLCMGKWTERGVTNLRMVVHCLDQEIEGYKDVRYYLSEHGEKVITPIVAAALRDYKSWRMAAYQVKRFLGD